MTTDQEPARSEEYQQAMALGHRLRRAGQYIEAAEAFSGAEHRLNGDRDALFYRATCLKQGQRNDEATHAYRTLLERHPSFAQGWSLLGVFLKNLGDYAGAIPALQNSLELRDDFETRNTLVVSLYKADRLDEALVEGRRNLELKDRTAIEAFSPSSGWALRKSAPPPFNPKTPQRNVISFSLWGDNPVYVQGAIINARIAPHIYYGWTTRFYCDDSVPADAVEELRRAGAQIVRMQDPALQAIRPMWRFLVSDDPNVDRFICRDADSRLNCQELLAVEEWLHSGKQFHVMRDHIYHMELMLAGMWGGTAGALPKLRERLLTDRRYFDNRFADQAFLMNEVWPLIRDDLCTHDTYYGFPDGRQFPAAYRLPRPIHVGGAVKTIGVARANVQ